MCSTFKNLKAGIKKDWICAHAYSQFSFYEYSCGFPYIFVFNQFYFHIHPPNVTRQVSNALRIHVLQASCVVDRTCTCL